jgi:hypothetical protein
MNWTTKERAATEVAIDETRKEVGTTAKRDRLGQSSANGPHNDSENSLPWQ